MTYLEHIRSFSDGQMAYFLNAIEPDIAVFSLAMKWTLADGENNGKNYIGHDVYHGLNGDARNMMRMLYKDYDKAMRGIEQIEQFRKKLQRG